MNGADLPFRQRAFRPDRVDSAALPAALLALAGEGCRATASGRVWTLPVCFDDDFAPDLADVAAHAGLTREAVVDLLAATEFTVAMLGFARFSYLGGLPAALEMPRLATPRTCVAAGSVAIAGRMCAVYPWGQPGRLAVCRAHRRTAFRCNRPGASGTLAPGDRVRWQPGRAGRARRMRYVRSP